MAERFCQQWDINKGTFVVDLMTRTGLHPRILLAWVAVESGGDPIAPRGARYNYLQIKERGDLGQTREGFAIYSSPNVAAKAAARRIKNEPGILKSIGHGSDAVMRAIAKAWDDGPGVARGPVPQGYLNTFKAKFNCITHKSVVEGHFLGIRAGFGDEQLHDPNLTERLGRVTKKMKEDGPIAAAVQLGKEATGATVDKVFSSDWAEDAVKVLLTGALAGTGLALFGYGLVKAFGSTGAGETAKHVASPAASFVAARR